jgi:hypothetical protein
MRTSTRGLSARLVAEAATIISADKAAAGPIRIEICSMAHDTGRPNTLEARVAARPVNGR